MVNNQDAKINKDCFIRTVSKLGSNYEKNRIFNRAI